jgi:hypothetical protein
MFLSACFYARAPALASPEAPIFGVLLPASLQSLKIEDEPKFCANRVYLFLDIA